MLPTKFRFIWPSGSEEIYKNRPIRNKNCLWQPCLLMDWDEMSNLYRGPSIDASYHVEVHLAEGFQRHISVIQFRYLYRVNCILNIFEQELHVSIIFLAEKKIFLEINQSKTRIAYGSHVC